MSFFLYKPHVYGPEGVTTPDVIIDTVLKPKALDDQLVPVDQLTSQTYLQAREGSVVNAGFAQVAAGGGVILCPVMAISGGQTIFFRTAWRVEHHLKDAMKLSFGGEDGYIHAFSASPKTRCSAIVTLPRETKAPKDGGALRLEMSCSDAPVLKAVLNVSILPQANREDFDGGPAPRYSVGPTRKPVKHYI